MLSIILQIQRHLRKIVRLYVDFSVMPLWVSRMIDNLIRVGTSQKHLLWITWRYEYFVNTGKFSRRGFFLTNVELLWSIAAILEMPQNHYILKILGCLWFVYTVFQMSHFYRYSHIRMTWSLTSVVPFSLGSVCSS